MELLNRLIHYDNFDSYLVIGILVFFGLIETLSGFLRNSKRRTGDWLQEIISFFTLSGLIKPAIVAAVLIVGLFFFPNANSILAEAHLGLVLLGYILIDDVVQYWYHRTAHERAFLWKLHRAHHQAEEMGFFVSYRNAALYYLMMPNIWWVGIVVLSGGAKAVAIGLVLKQLVIIGSHSRIKWDKPFYKFPILKPMIIVLERIIITPAFHHAHHGKSKLDGVSDPNGNFGNMFSFWDQLFGTAKFTHAYPREYGLQVRTHDSWTSAYLYPAIKSKDNNSELAAGFKKDSSSTKEPLEVQLKKGEKLLWCACGLSNNQPFCDGSHHGTKSKPVDFTAVRDGPVKLCNCKISKTAPFCDNSHLEL